MKRAPADSMVSLLSPVSTAKAPGQHGACLWHQRLLTSSSLSSKTLLAKIAIYVGSTSISWACKLLSYLADASHTFLSRPALAIVSGYSTTDSDSPIRKQGLLTYW
jgi:hypothetical protein